MILKLYLRPKQVCFLNCKNPSTHLHAPSKQLLFATFIEHCSGTIQSYPNNVAVKNVRINNYRYYIFNAIN